MMKLNGFSKYRAFYRKHKKNHRFREGHLKLKLASEGFILALGQDKLFDSGRLRWQQTPSKIQIRGEFFWPIL